MDKIYLDHVSFVYSAGTPYEQVALDDVCVGIREGCITGIIGHTGSGKSTMMQMLNGLIKPKSGKVLLDGYDINSTVEDVYDAWSEREEYAALSPRKRKKAMQAEIRARKSKLCLLRMQVMTKKFRFFRQWQVLKMQAHGSSITAIQK